MIKKFFQKTGKFGRSAPKNICRGSKIELGKGRGQVGFHVCQIQNRQRSKKHLPRLQNQIRKRPRAGLHLIRRFICKNRHKKLLDDGFKGSVLDKNYLNFKRCCCSECSVSTEARWLNFIKVLSSQPHSLQKSSIQAEKPSDLLGKRVSWALPLRVAKQMGIVRDI